MMANEALWTNIDSDVCMMAKQTGQNISGPVQAKQQTKEHVT